MYGKPRSTIKSHLWIVCWWYRGCPIHVGNVFLSLHTHRLIYTTWLNITLLNRDKFKLAISETSAQQTLVVCLLWFYAGLWLIETLVVIDVLLISILVIISPRVSTCRNPWVGMDITRRVKHWLSTYSTLLLHISGERFYIISSRYRSCTRKVRCWRFRIWICRSRLIWRLHRLWWVGW